MGEERLNKVGSMAKSQLETRKTMRNFTQKRQKANENP